MPQEASVDQGCQRIRGKRSQGLQWTHAEGGIEAAIISHSGCYLALVLPAMPEMQFLCPELDWTACRKRDLLVF